MKKIFLTFAFFALATMVGFCQNTANDSVNNNYGQLILEALLGIGEEVNRYAVSGNEVTYNGRVVVKADAKTFKYVGGEYGADKHHAYYKGEILGDAWGVRQFKYYGNGTASDGVHWYSNGLPVDRD